MPVVNNWIGLPKLLTPARSKEPDSHKKNYIATGQTLEMILEYAPSGRQYNADVTCRSGAMVIKLKGPVKE